MRYIQRDLLGMILIMLVKKLIPSRIFCSIGPAAKPPDSQRYRRMYFVVSVLPGRKYRKLCIAC